MCIIHCAALDRAFFISYLVTTYFGLIACTGLLQPHPESVSRGHTP